MNITIIQIFVINKPLHFVTGAVYRGKYKHESVAVKEFLTQSQVEAVYDEFDDTPGVPGYSYREVDKISEILLNLRLWLKATYKSAHNTLFFVIRMTTLLLEKHCFFIVICVKK